jgi:hypothetical protein
MSEAGVAEAERPARIALTRKRVAVEAGHDSVRLARNAHQRRRDEPARDAADEHADQQDDGVEARHVVGEGQRQRHQHPRRDARHDADDDAEEDARAEE